MEEAAISISKLPNTTFTHTHIYIYIYICVCVCVCVCVCNGSLFYQLDAPILILIHLLYSSICFEHYYAHLQENSCISRASGIVTLFR